MNSLLSRYFIKSRKRKEFIRRLRKCLRIARTFDDYGKKISEVDTQIILVEPVLTLAGYNIYDPFTVKRSSRSSTAEEFDIEVYIRIYNRTMLQLAIEVKALSSKEYNVDTAGSGAIFEYCGNCKMNNNEKKPTPQNLQWNVTGGAAASCSQSKTCSHYNNNGCITAQKRYGNYYGDGVGQLRAYCANHTHFQKGYTVPALTNGEEWIVFSNYFSDNLLKPINMKNEVIGRSKISDDSFYDAIVRKLRNTL